MLFPLIFYNDWNKILSPWSLAGYRIKLVKFLYKLFGFVRNAFISLSFVDLNLLKFQRVPRQACKLLLFAFWDCLASVFSLFLQLSPKLGVFDRLLTRHPTNCLLLSQILSFSDGIAWLFLYITCFDEQLHLNWKFYPFFPPSFFPCLVPYKSHMSLCLLLFFCCMLLFVLLHFLLPS